MTHRLWFKDIGRNEDRRGCSFVIQPMHSVLVFENRSAWTIRLRLSSAMVNNLALDDIVDCGSLLMVVNPKNATRFGGDDAQP